MIKIQYQGMNLLDEIHTVEIAFDTLEKQVHLYDPSAVIWPEYRGKVNGYILSDGFNLMIKVLGDKPFFSEIRKQNDSDWLERFTWFFYKKNTSVLQLKEGQIGIVKDYTLEHLYASFVERI